MSWARLAALWAALALLSLALDPLTWAWERALLLREPWRVLSGALAHWSVLHALANAAGALVLGWVGWRARLPQRAAWAWLAAWPLAQALLLLQPELQRVAGLSGVLHAGVAVLALGLWRGGERQLGAALALGLLGKIALEQPWGPALRIEAFWGAMPVVPWAHAAGALAGLLAALLLAERGKSPSGLGQMPH